MVWWKINKISEIKIKCSLNTKKKYFSKKTHNILVKKPENGQATSEDCCTPEPHTGWSVVAVSFQGFVVFIHNIGDALMGVEELDGVQEAPSVPLAR